MAISKKDISEFLDSPVLESYVVGNATREEQRQAEMFIELSQEVKQEYIRLQNDLERLVQQYATSAPKSAKEKAMAEIKSRSASQQKVIQMNWWKDWKSVAAILVAVAGVGYGIVMHGERGVLMAENQELNSLLDGLKSNQFALNAEKETISSMNEMLLDPTYEKISLTTEGTKGIQVAALWNNTKSEAQIITQQLPELPADKCYQLWADVEGAMLSVGVLKEGVLESPNFYANATSLNITIEPAGGNDHATVATLQTSGVIHS
ncbi:MAG: anti-sigma factor [Bacteroidota bacterium]